MYFKKQWQCGKKIITTDVSDAEIDIKNKKRGYIISFDKEVMKKEILEILENNNKENDTKTKEVIYDYNEENEINKKILYNKILGIIRK